MEVEVELLGVLLGEDDVHALFQAVIEDDIDIGRIQAHIKAAHEHAANDADQNQPGGNEPDQSAKMKHLCSFPSDFFVLG